MSRTKNCPLAGDSASDHDDSSQFTAGTIVKLILLPLLVVIALAAICLGVIWITQSQVTPQELVKAWVIHDQNSQVR